MKLYTEMFRDDQPSEGEETFGRDKIFIPQVRRAKNLKSFLPVDAKFVIIVFFDQAAEESLPIDVTDIGGRFLARRRSVVDAHHAAAGMGSEHVQHGLEGHARPAFHHCLGVVDRDEGYHALVCHQIQAFIGQGGVVAAVVAHLIENHPVEQVFRRDGHSRPGCDRAGR